MKPAPRRPRRPLPWLFAAPLLTSLGGFTSCSLDRAARADSPAMPGTTIHHEASGSTYYVQPFDSEPIGDPEALARLLRTMFERSQGDYRLPAGVVLTLDEFFTGNEDVGSFACNLGSESPHATPAAWHRALLELRADPRLSDVVVVNAEVDPHADGRIATWPYPDSVAVITSLEKTEIEALAEPLKVSDVFEQYALPADQMRSALAAAGVATPTENERVWILWWD